MVFQWSGVTQSFSFRQSETLRLDIKDRLWTSLVCCSEPRPLIKSRLLLKHQLLANQLQTVTSRLSKVVCQCNCGSCWLLTGNTISLSRDAGLDLSRRCIHPSWVFFFFFPLLPSLEAHPPTTVF